MGAGKTALAGWLAEQLGWQKYSLDDSIPDEGGSHQREVALTAIQQLQPSGKPVPVEGARFLETFKRQEIALLIFIDDTSPCPPSGQLQRAVEEYLARVRSRDDAIIVNIR